MAEFQDLTQTAGAHARFPEGQAPSTLNDGARNVEGILIRYFNDTNYSVQATVSGSVIQMTANRVSITLTGTTSNYMADLLMAFTMGSVASPDGCYININGIGAISLRSNSGTSLSASAIPTGTRALIIMDATNSYFRLLNPIAATNNLTVGGTLAVSLTASFSVVTAGGTLSVTGLSTLTGGARSGSFTQASPTNNTYYTALSAASQATNAYLIWVYSSSNVASSFYLLLYNPTGGNRVLTALSTGTEVGQLDGSSNFQIKTTSNAGSVSASWLRISS